MMESKKKNLHMGWLFFILLVLWNPLVHVVDVFPDFLAWFPLALLLTRAADVCPYFDEAKRGALKLGLVSVLKTFSLFVAVSSSGKDGSGDTKALFALCFAVLELILLYGFVRNLFEGLFYLGERSDAAALIRPFGRIAPETLRTLVYVFFGLRSVLSVLPEFLMLTDTDATAAVLRSVQKLYPPTVVICFVIVAAVGVLVLVWTTKYLCAVRKEGKFYAALEGMHESDRATIDARMATKRYQAAFLMLGVASVFSVAFPLDNFSGMDVLPPFMFGVLSLFALLTLQKVSPRANRIKWLAAAFSAESLASYWVLGAFLKKYGFDALTKDPDAVRAFDVCRILTAAEGLLGAALVGGIFYVMQQIITDSMGERPDSPAYSRADRDFHRLMKRKNLCLAILGGLSLLCSSAAIVLRGVVVKIDIDPLRLPEGTTASTAVVGSVLPWFGAAQVAVAVLFVFAVFNVLGTFKAEVQAKAEAFGGFDS